ncbi:MAG: CBS domain-containing protein, partial [Gemmatimonadetes bacterium]|nr:CBS domain-containing protein [Gemmatimonadota bacterium]NIT87470.1 CBS domain-containing protein [Gemmatimonadota bacterium]NIU75159.1 CBS domain-containing protein [Gammaproteobacteria bacterium]NIY09212.1 CBS domain-containing protein [Gemmatimonadota bacterium]NIY39612.1 CBS domain-containing protein [Gemmatimonadota bacterium]
RGGGANRVMVVDEGGRLVGIISASDVARWIQKRQTLAELAGDGGLPAGGRGE